MFKRCKSDWWNNYTVDTNGANVVFASGDAPLASDTVHILELPI